jgi:CheY-like chemotaxis protein
MSATSSQLPDLSGLIVLVVDDNEDVIELLTATMNACGAEVLFARSASDGLACLEAAPPVDVIVTDISMPPIDGYEFTRQIRALPSGARRSVPVIALTGFQQQYVITETFDAFMQKPVDPARLCAVIKILRTRTRGSSSVTRPT